MPYEFEGKGWELFTLDHKVRSAPSEVNRLIPGVAGIVKDGILPDISAMKLDRRLWGMRSPGHDGSWGRGVSQSSRNGLLLSNQDRMEFDVSIGSMAAERH
jgi:hypothetical protein